MTTVSALVSEIDSLPSSYLDEIADFIGYLKMKTQKQTATSLTGEDTLARLWNSPAENAQRPSFDGFERRADGRVILHSPPGFVVSEEAIQAALDDE